MSHHLLLILHIFAATIWVGGHTYLIFRVFPKVLRHKDTEGLLAFEKSYEPLGMSALVILVITGAWMATQYGISLNDIFSFSGPIERLVSLLVRKHGLYPHLEAPQRSSPAWRCMLQLLLA